MAVDLGIGPSISDCDNELGVQAGCRLTLRSATGEYGRRFQMEKMMPAKQFDRDSMARWYAEEHLKTDPGIVPVYYLPTNADEREIRFIEVNCLIGDRNDVALEPIDFGVDAGMDSAHRLFVLDVTPEQWDRMRAHQLQLPANWSLDSAVHSKMNSYKNSGGSRRNPITMPLSCSADRASHNVIRCTTCKWSRRDLRRRTFGDPGRHRREVTQGLCNS